MTTRTAGCAEKAWRMEKRGFIGTLECLVLRWLHRKPMRIVNGVVGERASAQEARTPANSTQDTYHDGWQACAGLLRSRLKRNGYL